MNTKLTKNERVELVREMILEGKYYKEIRVALNLRSISTVAYYAGMIPGGISEIDKAKARFFRLVAKGNKGECWEWIGAKDWNGYGYFWSETGHEKAHRTAYRWFVGPIGDGMFVCHSCDNPGCVNPAHLFQGSPQDNVTDMMIKNRGRYGKNAPKSW